MKDDLVEVDMDLFEKTQRDFQLEVMATYLAYLRRAFNCLNDLPCTDELLEMMENVELGFILGDKYMTKIEGRVTNH